MKITENALAILKTRYLPRNEQGNILETPEEMIRRVAHVIAGAEKDYGRPEEEISSLEEEFYQIMTNLDFLPNLPALVNAGRPLGNLAACFAIDVGDSMHDIFKAVYDIAMIFKTGGGMGLSFSQLRPKGAYIKSSGGQSSGPISFMEVFNAATGTVKQGSFRRGASLGLLRVDHPDIIEFITCKDNPARFTNFNISVAITDAFTQAIEEDKDQPLIAPHTGEVVGHIKANKLFDLIANMAWKSGEPGIVFIDEINRYNPTPHIAPITTVNACGEQPLLPLESCTLGSINLSNLVQDYPHPQVNYDRLRYLVHTAVRFLDNVIDVNVYPLPEIEKATKLTRKIGLGIMGLADMFIKMSIPYNSEQALVLAEKVMQFIQEESHRASRQLARERGPFPSFEGSAWDTDGSGPIRNATTTTIAPTGTIAILAGCSASIEPLFAVAYTRKMADGYEPMKEVHPLFQKVTLERGFYSTKLIEECSIKPSIQHVSQIPEDVRRLFLTASDVPPEWHVRMQATIQKYVDNASSKTINLSKAATPEEVKEVILLAHKLSCKGITVYRDGSRKDQAISTAESYQHYGSIAPRPRPQVTSGFTKKHNIGCGSLFITFNSDDLGPCEIFTNTGRKGGCPSQSEATARLVSMALRAGITIEAVIEQLRGIRCLSTVSQRHSDNIEVLSCPDAIGRVMEEIIKDKGIELLALDGKRPCPDCGLQLESDGGCAICRNCGYSKCG